jgi:prophage antirepressor-like protein
MANEVTGFNFHDLEVRTVLIDNEPWFVGKDVATALGYERTADAIRTHVDVDDKLGRRFADSGQNREMTVINESGVYSLIFGSKLPSAQEFKHWVTKEVLPSIRKTGGYQAQSMTEDEIVGQALMIEHNRAERLQAENDIMRPKAEIHDVFIATGGAIGLREAAKEMEVKQTDLVDKLLNSKYIYRTRGHHGKLQPYNHYVPKYFVLKSGGTNSEGVEFLPSLKITPAGREYFYKKFFAPNQMLLEV